MDKKIALDNRREAFIGESTEDAIDFACTHWIAKAISAIKNDGAFFVALSGGSTPKKLLQKLSSEPFASQVDWSKIYFFFSDERCVPPTNDQSNYKMAMDSGLSKLPIPKEHIFRLKGEIVPQQAAAEYELAIHDVVTLNTFHLVMLGMGDDGHTASLFPGTEALDVKDKLVAANFVPKVDMWRLTFTYPLINRAKEIAIYVLGDGKNEMVSNVFSPGGDQYPISKIGTPEHKALWILDNKSAQTLLANVNSRD